MSNPEETGPDQAGPSDGEQRLFRLAVDEHVETYLDLETAEQIEVPVSPEDGEAGPVAGPTFTPIHDSLLEAFADRGWYHYNSDAPGVTVNLTGDQAVFTCRYVAYEESQLIACCVRVPMTIPKSSRRRAMEYITRVNFGISYGALEMDLDDGRMFYRTSLDVEDGRPTTAMVCNMAGCGVGQLDRFLPGLMEVVYARKAPAEAVRAIR